MYSPTCDPAQGGGDAQWKEQEAAGHAVSIVRKLTVFVNAGAHDPSPTGPGSPAHGIVLSTPRVGFPLLRRHFHRRASVSM